MKLRHQFSLILLAIMIISTIIVLLSYEYFLIPSIEQIELSLADKDVGRSQDTIKNALKTMSETAHDWATWDDTYNFVNTGNEAYKNVNLTASTFSDNNLDIILFYNENKVLIWGKVLNKHLNPGISETIALEKVNNLILTKYENFLYNDKMINYKKNVISGVLMSSYGPIMIALSPILKSDRTSCRGSVITGRFLTADYIKSLSDSIKVPFKLYEITRNNYGNFKDIIDGIDKSYHLSYAVQKNDELFLYSYLGVLGKENPLLMKVIVPRDIYLIASKTLNSFVVAVLIACVILLLVSGEVVQKFLITPISSLTHNIHNIQTTKDLTVNIDSTRKDEIGTLTKEFIKMIATIKNVNNSLEDLVDERTKELKLSREDTILRLAIAAEKRDTDTGTHVKRISEYSKLLARKCGLDESKSEIIGQASLLHDIGKIGISDQILRKPGKLDSEEFEIIKSHTSIGAKMLENSNSLLLSTAKDIAFYHHEQWCGKGYPNGLAGEDIPLSARIVTIVDVFDALISERVYKDNWSINEVTDFFKKNKGVLFDPTLVDIFISNIDLFAPKIVKES